VDEISKQVVDPQTGVSVFDRRRAHDAINARTAKEKEEIMNRKKMDLGALGSGSDYSSFIQHAGIPSLNLGYGGEDGSGDYHSIYDSYDMYTRFIDPGFVYCATLAKTTGRAVLRMAEADLLPFDYSNLYKTVSGYSKEVMDLLQRNRENTRVDNMLINAGSYAAGDDPTKGYIEPKAKAEVPFLDFAPLQNALQQLAGSVDSLNREYNNNLESGNTPVAFNKLLYRGEQQLLAARGLPRRPWYRNILYAPGYYTGYGVKTLPGIREAIEQRNWEEAQQQIKVDAEVLEKLAGYLRQQAVSSR
jgi:N-acetylated-alpha-linked acidic dipeptidase